MSGFDQSSIAVSMPTVVGADAALGGPYKIKPSEAFSGALMTVSGLTGETISVETSPDGYWGAPASPTFYRTDWQGTSLLYPTARTNLSTYSNGFDNAAWLKVGCSYTAAAATAPGGATTAFKLVESALDEIHWFRKTITLTAGVRYTVSCCVKAAERSQVYLRVGLGYVIFDLTTKAASASGGTGTAYGYTDLGNGWLRLWVAWTQTVTQAEYMGIALCSGGTNTYAGDGASGLYVFGFQQEAGSAPTSYIPTTTAAVTVTDYTLSNGVITLAQAPITGATLSYDNSVLPSPYYIFATGDGVRTQFAYDGVWGTLSANSGKGNGIWQIDLRGAQAYRLVKSAGSETATVNMTLKRDALQYTNSAGTWSVT